MSVHRFENVYDGSGVSRPMALFIPERQDKPSLQRCPTETHLNTLIPEPIRPERTISFFWELGGQLTRGDLSRLLDPSGKPLGVVFEPSQDTRGLLVDR